MGSFINEAFLLVEQAYQEQAVLRVKKFCTIPSRKISQPSIGSDIVSLDIVWVLFSKF